MQYSGTMKTCRMILCSVCKSIQQTDVNQNYDSACPNCGYRLVPLSEATTEEEEGDGTHDKRGDSGC